MVSGVDFPVNQPIDESIPGFLPYQFCDVPHDDH